MNDLTHMNRQDTGVRLDLLAIGIIAVVWILMAAITDPRGEFPLNDDWNYALSVRSLVQDGTFRMTFPTTMTLVTQVLWGALFCIPFGFSFTALRISTLVAGLGGLIAIYLLARELGVGRRMGLIAALTVAVNPIYFGLSNTFMTDVLFFALSAFSIYAFVRSLQRESSAGYVIGIILACLAVLLRQAALVLPVAFGLGHLLRHRVRLLRVVQAAIPSAAVGLSLVVYKWWLDATGRLPEFYNYQVGRAGGFFDQGSRIFEAFWHVLLAACVYLGLLLFPLLLVGFVARFRPWKLAVTAALALAFYLLIRPIGWMGGMPLYVGICHVLVPQGIGPITLPDIIRAHPNLSPLPQGFWLIITWISALGASMLVIHLLTGAQMLLRRSDMSQTARPLMAMMAAGCALCLAPALMLYFFVIIDRYYLPAIPFLIGAIVLIHRPPMKLGRVITAAIIVMLILGGTLSVGLTHDYLAWNRARWSALNDLVAKRVPPLEIEGGYEINGLCFLDSRYGGDWSNRFVDKKEALYAITFGPYPDYEPVKAYPYQNWIPPRQGRVFVMRRSW